MRRETAETLSSVLRVDSGLPQPEEKGGNRREEKRETERDDADRVFRPSAFLKVMMQRCHAEEAFSSGHFEVEDLQNNRYSFKQIYEADRKKEQRIPERKNGADNHCTEEERASIPHENGGGMEIESK